MKPVFSLYSILCILSIVNLSTQNASNSQAKSNDRNTSVATTTIKQKIESTPLIKNSSNISAHSVSNSTSNSRINFETFNIRNDNGIDASHLLGPDDQCKMLYGKDASFCRSNFEHLCKNLYCRKSLNDPCVQVQAGAREGTVCDSGKICVQKECRESQRAPIGDCLFGDDLVKQDAIGMNLPSPQMVCKDVLNHIISISQTPTAYCSNSNFRSICCETCKKYDILSCTDRYFDCPRYKTVCKTATINGLSVMMLCPRTCNKCSALPVYCADEKYICQNGGKCVNTTVPDDSLFGFKCECQLGFYGDLCEKKDSCLPNPCKIGEKCISYGNIAYKCQDPKIVETTTKISSTTQTRPTTTFATTTTTTKKQLKIANKQSNNPNCVNSSKDDVCNYYAEQDLCSEDYYLNGKPITQECAKSCGKC